MECLKEKRSYRRIKQVRTLEGAGSMAKHEHWVNCAPPMTTVQGDRSGPHAWG
ncbi:hypothetical protein SXCC_00870 [Gluconacetobacter sp. SXCC-1]|nr:hypothetical protein SXCC_00870 [Gluconacetobacter sp. SXCC-1]